MGIVKFPLAPLRDRLEMYTFKVSKRVGESANEREDVSLGSRLFSAEEDEGSDEGGEEGLNGGASCGRGNAVTLEDELSELLIDTS